MLARLIPATLVALALAWAPTAAAAPSWLGLMPIGSPTTSSPVVGMSGAGEATVVWTGPVAGVPQVRAATRPPGGAFGAPFPVSGATTDVGSAAVAVSRPGRVVVAWAQLISGQWYVRARFRSVAGGWSAIKTLSDPAASAPRLAVGIADSGEASVLWLQAPNAIQTRRLSAAGAWTASAQTLTQPGHPATANMQPRLVVDRSGNATAAWVQDEPDTGGPGTVESIVWAERTAGGAWTLPVPLTPASDTGARLPLLAVGPQGHVVLAWLFRSEFRVEAKVRPARGLWSATQPVQNSVFGPTAAAVDATGAATLAWGGDVHPFELHRRPPAGAWAAEPLPGLVLAEPAAHSLAVTPDGRVLMAWGAHDSNMVIHFQAAARSAAGWGQAQDLVASSRVAGTQIVGDDQGNALAVWYDDAGAVSARAYDGAGPDLLGVGVPAQATSGAPVTLTATPRDRWSAVAARTWSFGDGAAASGASATHTYSRPGTYTVRFTATDALGQDSTAQRTIAVVNPAVTLQSARLRGKFKRSRLRGKVALVVTGRLAAGGDRRLTVRLRGPLRPKGKVGSVTAGELTVAPGSFARTVKLRRRARARLLPGRYRAVIAGPGLAQGADRFQIAAPPEGVVLSKKISTSAHGRSILRITRTKALWASFRFADAAPARRDLTAEWYPPGHRTPAATNPVGRSKPFTFWKQTSDLATGRWRVVLRAGRRIVDSVSVRVG
ncbi:MAG TPA: PKD domain-containing protein [Solirubrobacteraceae bacterium]|nr:PKD domain-containing protein [Solirubrobacteraceae bacterium]